jgi:hypothetical protein
LLGCCVLQREARLAVQSWEAEQRKVVWDLGVIGLPCTSDFVEITQPLLQDAMRWWAAEELPRRRATKYGFMRDHVRSLADLSTSLRIHRDDDGADPTLLGRVGRGDGVTAAGDNAEVERGCRSTSCAIGRCGDRL